MESLIKRLNKQVDCIILCLNADVIIKTLKLNWCNLWSKGNLIYKEVTISFCCQLEISLWFDIICRFIFWRKGLLNNQKVLITFANLYQLDRDQFKLMKMAPEPCVQSLKKALLCCVTVNFAHICLIQPQETEEMRNPVVQKMLIIVSTLLSPQ